MREKILEYLTGKRAASTRLICNFLYGKRTDKFTIKPGSHAMGWTYNDLKTLEKQGKVKKLSPGLWAKI